MGLLTKIFGTEASSEHVAEPALGDAGPSDDLQEPVAVTPGVGPVKAAAVAASEPPSIERPEARRRMYLRPPPVRNEPSAASSTRQPRIVLRPSVELPASSHAPDANQVALEARFASFTGPLPQSEAAHPAALNEPRPRAALVVSPVSLTEEELQLQEGARPKALTLTGLGAVRAAPVPLGVQRPERLGDALTLVADFALKLSLGAVSALWTHDVLQAAATLQAAARRREDAALTVALSRLRESLESGTPDGAGRVAILEALHALPALLPEWPESAKDLTQAARVRGQRILHELFSILDGLTFELRERLERSMSLEELSRCSPEALADALDTPVERAQELGEIVAAYALERQAEPPDPGNLRGLSRALDELVQRCREFDEHDGELGNRLRLSRQRRREAMMRINLLLVDRGELELVDRLEPCGASERIERLRDWLDSRAQGRA